MSNPQRKSRRSRSDQRRPRLAAVVLAAGEGKRMRSGKAKVLHELAGRPMVLHVLDTVARLKPDRSVVVVGFQAAEVSAVVEGRAVCVSQPEQLGTGHALMQARLALRGFRGDVLVLCGDAPLLTATTLRRLLALHRRRQAVATVLGMVADDASGYGHIVRDGGQVRIVEDADASRAEREIDEVNTGTYCFEASFLFRHLRALRRANVQQEYYLTDILEIGSKLGRAQAMILDDDQEGMGVNSRFDLARAEALIQERLILKWMERGVTFLDPSTVYLSMATRIGRDTVIGPNVRIDGTTSIGRRCTVDGSSFLRDTLVGNDVHIRWGVVMTDSRVGNGALLGPYAHLRPQADLGANVHVGNFVEVKKATLGPRSKANHLSYIGDTTVGRDVNIGAGTITCNYDGFRKYRTVIGDRVQIGSDTQLVAPVVLGNDVYVAAGSTVSADVEPGALVFNDKRQRVRSGWVEAFRKRSKAGKRSD